MIVLVVEDEPIAAISLALELEASGHIVVGPTASGVEAVRLARQQRPTVALLDITLDSPGDGIDVARTLQHLGIPSLFLTAQPSEARANADAALGLIAKPYTMASVCQSLEIIGAVLEGHAPPADTGSLELFR